MKSGRTPTPVLVGLLFFAAIGLLTGLYTGLLRLGFLNDVATHSLSPMAHGPLMINGFLGTLIGLERAAALDKKSAYLGPALIAASTVLILTGFRLPGLWLLLLGSVGLAVVMVYLYFWQPKVYHLIMAFGAVSLLIGNVFFVLGFPIYAFVGWWAAFPMLTIFGERLELNRIMRPPQKAQQLFIILISLWIASLILTHFSRTLGWSIGALLLIGISIWLIKYDVARRTIKSTEWTRYSAICLLTGYGWLIMAGLFVLINGYQTAGPLYDGFLHIIFVGFIFSMIFAHASVIIPSLSGKLIPYHNYFYLPLILLHGFLLVRITGDIIWLPLIRKVGGYGNVLAILLFLGGVLFQLSKASLEKKKNLAKK